MDTRENAEVIAKLYAVGFKEKRGLFYHHGRLRVPKFLCAQCELYKTFAYYVYVNPKLEIMCSECAASIIGCPKKHMLHITKRLTRRKTWMDYKNQYDQNDPIDYKKLVMDALHIYDHASFENYLKHLNPYYKIYPEHVFLDDPRDVPRVPADKWPGASRGMYLGVYFNLRKWLRKKIFQNQTTICRARGFKKQCRRVLKHRVKHYVRFRFDGDNVYTNFEQDYDRLNPNRILENWVFEKEPLNFAKIPVSLCTYT